MAGSGRRAVAAGLVIAIACGGLTGCVSTQRKNARAKLVAERTLDGRRPQLVRERNRDVRVVDAALVHGRRGGAVVVTLRNRGSRSLTDVPITVGVRGRNGRRTPLNGGRGLAWYQTHVPAIGAGEATAWVFTTRRRVPGGRPYAVAGAPAGPIVTEAGGGLPGVAATAVPTRGARRARGGRGARSAVRVALDNRSNVPQYGLQVYAVARDGGRVVAAGKATVRHLATRGRARAQVPLVGTPGERPVRVHALPTIFE